MYKFASPLLCAESPGFPTPSQKDRVSGGQFCKKRTFRKGCYYRISTLIHLVSVGPIDFVFLVKGCGLGSDEGERHGVGFVGRERVGCRSKAKLAFGALHPPR